MKAVFLSDAHISDHTDPNLAPLLSFLEHVQGKVERLYLVGDLFHTWFGFPYAVFDEYVPLLGALHGVARSGARIIYITGNHDFEAGHFFEEILKADVHDTEVVVEEDGRRAFVAHGDMANPKDRGYRRLRRILRARFTRWLGRQLPPKWVWRIGGILSQKYSGKIWLTDRASLHEILNTYVARKYRQGFDTVILGHFHVPAFDRSDGPDGPHTYVNLGEWMRRRTFLRWDDGELRLMQWTWPEAVERTFEPGK